ncbi:MAG: hypothetical protein IT366_02310 [Candidatus Hydrogenedentes bacterium]|nr:hypothetical protein [Candidatus Hydrogenedentota bacterium]
MEKMVRIFDRFEEAEEAEFEYLRSLTLQQRVDALLEPLYWANRDAVSQGLQRVLTVT